jgi:hypothetical protein
MMSLRVGSHPGNSMPAAREAASAVAADEILRPQRLARSESHFDAGLVLRDPGHLTSVVDLHRQLGDPVGHDPLDLVLPDRERASGST